MLCLDTLGLPNNFEGTGVDQLAKPIFRSRYAHTPFGHETKRGPMDTVASSAGDAEFTSEPRHDKTNKVNVRPAKTQISLGIRPV